MLYLCRGFKGNNAAVAQLVEHQLPKLRVAGSSPVCRSKHKQPLKRLLVLYINVHLILGN